MRAAKYKKGERLFFSYYGQKATATILESKKRFWAPWTWKYLIEFRNHSAEAGVYWDELKWIGERHLHEY